ncbi:MAG: hypothetical protein IKT01_01830 [Eubacteriaceae bacterium]|nr:hypothetical protein [Eubacteriaceae bacterium]
MIGKLFVALGLLALLRTKNNDETRTGMKTEKAAEPQGFSVRRGDPDSFFGLHKRYNPGETVIFRTREVPGKRMHVFMNGKELFPAETETGLAVYRFVMPTSDVTVTCTKEDIPSPFTSEEEEGMIDVYKVITEDISLYEGLKDEYRAGEPVSFRIPENLYRKYHVFMNGKELKPVGAEGGFILYRFVMPEFGAGLNYSAENKAGQYAVSRLDASTVPEAEAETAQQEDTEDAGAKVEDVEDDSSLTGEEPAPADMTQAEGQTTQDEPVSENNVNEGSTEQRSPENDASGEATQQETAEAGPTDPEEADKTDLTAAIPDEEDAVSAEEEKAGNELPQETAEEPNAEQDDTQGSSEEAPNPRLYRVICDNRDFFDGLKDFYQPGETVSISVPVTSDSSFRVLLNGEKLEPLRIEGYDARFEFTMPERDVKLDYEMDHEPDMFFAEPSPVITAADKAKEGDVLITVNGSKLVMVPEDNTSAMAFANLLEGRQLTLELSDYGEFEKVGDLGTTIPTNDMEFTASPGNVVLYNGSQISIYYGINPWNFTLLGKIDATGEELKEILGPGNVTVTFSLV